MSDQETDSIIMDIMDTSTTEPASGNLDLDLDTLWEMLDRHRLVKEGEQLGQEHINTTWELVIVQGVLLTLLVILAIVWAVFCRRRCVRGQDQDQLSVSEALRKVSAAKRDVPCSYSRTDINSLGISVNDYLNPPPAYLDLFTDNLQYLDLEQGHNRLAKLSFCNEDGSVQRLARLSVASCENCNTESPCVVPTRSGRSSVSSSSTSSSRRQSRANSRVSFSEEVECSNGSIRRLSTNSLISELISNVIHDCSVTGMSTNSGHNFRFENWCSGHQQQEKFLVQRRQQKVVSEVESPAQVWIRLG